MRRRYNSSSETYSTLSELQPVTRASSTTAVASEDIFGQNRYNASRNGSKSSKYVESLTVDGTTDSVVDDVEPYGPYFSLPPDPTSDISPLARRPTTKELISRYESITKPAKSPGETSSLEFPKRTSTAKAEANEKKGKGRSPIRQSFRNLLSVFSKKGKLGKGTSSPVLSEEELSGIALELRKPDPLRIPTPSDLSIAKQSLDTHACTTPLAQYSGKLLHLCYPDIRDAFPVWTECNVVLHRSHLLVTWHTVNGNPSTSMISFEQCTDVRSLGLGELDGTERKLLPSAPEGDVRPFEMLFEGRAREKFAARSVKERAGWVSAIWDAVLKANEERAYTPSLLNPHSVPPFSREPSPQLSTNEQIPNRESSGSRSSYSTDRELPGIPRASPQPSTPARYELYDAPVPKTASPSPTPTKSTFLTPPPTGRSQSPSIRNLDQRSVVKQRLAEIERTASMKTTSSSEKSTRSRQIVGSSYSPATTRVPLSIRTTGLPRMATVASPGESIIDSYGADSPLSMYSGRLTSIPSGRSLQIEDSPTPKSNANIPSSTELLSPASNYSIKAPSPMLPPPSIVRPSNSGQTKSMFTRPPSSIETVIPRASELRMNIEQEARISALQGQLVSVQRGLESLPKAVGAVIGGRAEPPTAPSCTTNNETKEILGSIDDSVRRIGDQGEHNAQGLSGIHAKVDALFSLHSQMAATGQRLQMSPVGNVDLSSIMGRLEEIRGELKGNLPLLAQKLEQIIMDKIPYQAPGITSMSNVPASHQNSAGVSEESASIHSKLDNLLAIYQAAQEMSSDKGTPEDGTRVQEILDLIKGDQALRTQQMEQQADNARYLHELNTWLETFVAHGTSQIETVVAGVQQLCKDMGPVSEGVAPDGQSMQQEGSSLLADVRRLLVEHQERGDNTAALYESVNRLMVAIREDLRHNTETQNALTTESIVTLVERQRQDQEQMLRTLATELSNDIRGERLRFVEAMKEATTINVQIHVEEFKKELTREVLLMTQEVARLHRERQNLEQHIADLFAFYAKQKQNGLGTKHTAPQQQQQRHPRPQDQYLQVPARGAPSRGRRPLPSPTPRGMPGV